jgi:hypothetical protein
MAAMLDASGRMESTQMSNEQTIDWTGKSGKAYRYWFISDITSNGIKAVAGNYAFVKRLANGNFIPLYFGHAEVLNARIPNHDRWDDAKKAGVTHVMGHTQAGEQARLDEERDLIQQWNPPLNVHHRTKVS